MNPLYTTYLSLGSNLDNKLENLQAAVNSINKSIGSVQKISSVYKTPAWGFEGNDFLNTCIEVHTSLTPKELLAYILNLEKELGRTRGGNPTYQNRTIDIDIILFENEVINTADLIIPHPKALERLFVLLPLEEITRNTTYPNTKNSLAELILKCSDTSKITKTTFLLFKQK